MFCSQFINIKVYGGVGWLLLTKNIKIHDKQLMSTGVYCVWCCIIITNLKATINYCFEKYNSVQSLMIVL